MSICSFKSNRAQCGRLVKHKSLLCNHVLMQQWGVNCWYTYSTVFKWMSIRAVLTLRILRDKHTKSVDFFLDHTQDGVKSEIFIKLPIGFGVEGCHQREWIIRIDKYIYGLKDAGLVLFEKIKEDMDSRGFVQYQLNPCVCYRE